MPLRGLAATTKIMAARTMKVAVEGCCHGELDAIYGHIAQLERRNNYKVDLLLICGDFQAIRNHQDLQCMAVPQKYRQLGEFHRYYTGEKKAPILTLVIGGNHEASNYLWELYHGGWLAPNIYFLGHAGCVQVNGVRIAGSSGIFKGNDFGLGHYEKMPYDNSSMRSIYHVREYNIARLSLLSSPNIFLSHDWPVGIEQYGDVQGLLQRKPFFRGDIESGRLGSPPLMGLLMNLKPEWWFSAHLHVRFEATVVHEQGTQIQQASSAPVAVENPDEIVIEDDDDEPGDQVKVAVQEKASIDPSLSSTPQNQTDNSAETANINPDEIVLEEEEEEVATPPKLVVHRETRFLALDKCLPRRQFLEVVDIPVDLSYSQPSGSDGQSTPRLTFDPEWLAITRAFHPYISISRRQQRLPPEQQARDMVEKELWWVLDNIGDRAKRDGLSDISDCQVFWPTAPGPGNEGGAKNQQPPWYTNPQTAAFCSMLEVENKINPAPIGMTAPSPAKPTAVTESRGEPNGQDTT